jgi:hypothetical protein
VQGIAARPRDRQQLIIQGQRLRIVALVEVSQRQEVQCTHAEHGVKVGVG